MAEGSVSLAGSHIASSAAEPGIKERYTSREYLALEVERLWPRVWQVVCHHQQIPSPGDFFEYTIVDQSFLVVRGADGRVKAFHNACQHRGMQLKCGAGSATELRCPSHAWTWNLDGTLKAVTDVFDFDPAAVAPECLALPEVRVDTWGGFIFINPDGQAAPLLEFLSPVAEAVDHNGVENMRLQRVRSTVVQANWKLGYEAFVESYHLIGTHPQSLQYFDETELIFEQYGDHGLHRAREGAMGSPSRRLDPDTWPEKMEMVLTLLSDLGGADLFGEEDAGQMNAMVDMLNALPADAGITGFVASLRRGAAAAAGIDVSDVSDYDLISGPVWNVFPNFTIPTNALNAIFIRWRPNGWDPNTSILDVFYLEHQGPDAPAPRVEAEFYERWSDCKGWGRVFEQDFTNLAGWQKGVRSAGFRGPIWGRPDGNNSNFHRALSTYVGGNDKG
jgi:nitrite reductase/ring-hydroxylating ferredoxin subunit